MPRTPAKFTQADIARATRAAMQAGPDMVVELVADGTIRISKAAQRQELLVDTESEIRL